MSDAKWISVRIHYVRPYIAGMRTKDEAFIRPPSSARLSVRLLSADAVGFSVTPFRCRRRRHRRCRVANAIQVSAHHHGFTWMARVYVCVCLRWMSGNDGWFNYSCCLASTHRTARRATAAVISTNCNDAHLYGPHKSAHTQLEHLSTCNMKCCQPTPVAGQFTHIAHLSNACLMAANAVI